MKTSLAVCTVCFQKQSPKEYLSILTKAGFSAIDIYHRQVPTDLSAEARKDIVDFLANSEMNIISLCSGFGHNYTDKDESIGFRRLEEDKKGIDLAAILLT